MDRSRLEYLREEHDAERLSLVEGLEIEEAFAQINSTVYDLYPPTWTDMLDDLEVRYAKDWVYEPTHVSVSDDSTAMLVSQTDTTITLINEEGISWTDPADQWTAIK